MRIDDETAVLEVLDTAGQEEVCTSLWVWFCVVRCKFVLALVVGVPLFIFCFCVRFAWLWLCGTILVCWLGLQDVHGKVACDWTPAEALLGFRF